MVHNDKVLPVLSEFKNAKSFLFIGNNVNGFENISKQLGPDNLLTGFGAVGGKRNGHKAFFADVDPKQPYKKSRLFWQKPMKFSTGQITGKLKTH